MPRIKIIEIEEAKCNGCGQCVLACHEGVLSLHEGKAKVLKEALCDGLGSCIPACPKGAIRIKEKEVTLYQHPEPPKDLKWPVQLRLISPLHRFSQKDLVIASDCTAFTAPSFHEILNHRRVLIGCPKFDDREHTARVLQTILQNQSFDSVEVMLMEVPCCSGLRALVEGALQATGKLIPLTCTVFGVGGTIKKRESIRPGE
ncbi:MAG: 4Fe-4S dicluster domain-containing protein [Atribacterota bacterium]